MKNQFKNPGDLIKASRDPKMKKSVMNHLRKKGAVKLSGSFKGKSNKLGQGGRAAQLKAQGVPGGVIGKLARAAQAAPGQKNFHKKAKKVSKAEMMAMKKSKKKKGAMPMAKMPSMKMPSMKAPMMKKAKKDVKKK